MSRSEHEAEISTELCLQEQFCCFNLLVSFVLLLLDI